MLFESARSRVARQWQQIARRTPTYLQAYRDQPTADSRAQRRAEWVATHVLACGPRRVLEIGCGPGRNLAALARRQRGLGLFGTDINAEALREARRWAFVWQSDLHDPAWRALFDVILALGVFCHIAPQAGPKLLAACMAHAGTVLIVDQVGRGEVLKGPRWWRPTVKVTGEYIVWAHPLVQWAGQALRGTVELPPELRSIGARELLVIRGR